MKQLLCSLMLLVAGLGNSWAQRSGAATQALPGGGTPPGPSLYDAPITGFADAINAVFQSVDKSRVPSGILEEYGLQFIDHVSFTGTNGFTVANQLDINRWRALYGDLYGARINSNAAAMQALSGVNVRLELYANEPNVELPILHFDYHSIRTDALSSGRIQSISNRLYDVAGQDPYQLNTAFAVAASATDLPSATPSFIFRPGLFYTNTGRTVATLQADLADGNGFVAMSWNVAHPVSYAAGGAKDVRVRVGYTDGSTWESHLLVVSPPPAPAARYAGSGPNVTEFQLTADEAWGGAFASATISVEYGGRNKPTPDPAVLDKPLIVVKGIDLSGYITGIPRSVYPLFAARINIPLINQGVLSAGLDDVDGYDIVYVDFNSGMDYIQRNALLLQRVIRWVNEQKALNSSVQPTAMLAMSMGGLVAQYALRDIEVDGAANAAYPHQVSLLITHDTPHQGANIPLGMQMAVRHLAGTVIRNPIGDDITLVNRVPALRQALDALYSPAAQQMLCYQTTQLNSGTFRNAGSVVASTTSLYDTFQQEYQTLLGPTKVPVGTPGKPCRVVASSNGSECGRGQPFGPYAELVSYDYNTTVSFPFLSGLLAVGTVGFGGWYGAIAGFISGPVAIAATAVAAVAILGFTGAYDIKASLSLHALPDQQQQQVYSVFAQVNKRTRLFGLFRVQYDLLDFQAYSNAAHLPLDSGAGGIIDLAEYAPQVGGALGALPAGVIKAQQFCFIPTYSALNITPGGSAALWATYSPGTSVGTPFANFRPAGRENEPHLQYTVLNSNWMLQEIRQMPQVLNCAAFCQAAPTISGSPIVCSSENYSLLGLPTGTTVAWRAEPTYILANSTQQGSVFVANTTANSGEVLLKATISSDCGQYTIERRIYAGLPEPPVASAGTLSCMDYGGSVTIQNFDVANTYSATSTGDVFFFGPNRRSIAVTRASFNFKTGGPGSLGDITLQVSNACGTTTGGTSIDQTGCRPAPTAALYPNPARETVDVHVTNATPAAPVTVRLFDAYGRPRAEQTSTGQETVRLKTDQLPAGLYFVHLLRGPEVLSRQQLRIEK